MKRLLLFAAALTLSGCTCGVPDPSTFTFGCDAAYPCDAGWYCNASSLCVQCQYDAGEICDNGIDDNCDGLVDCEDPSCLDQRCGFGGGQKVCCSTGPSTTSCLSLDSDPNNCGACGITCPSGSCGGAQCDCGGGQSCPSGQTCCMPDGGPNGCQQPQCECTGGGGGSNPMGCPSGWGCFGHTCCPPNSQCGGG